MKTAETKSASHQSHNTAAKSFFNQGQEQSFFSEHASDRDSFFPSTTLTPIQFKSIAGETPFFAPAPAVLQAKCATCEAEEQAQVAKEPTAEPPTVQRTPAFESEGTVQAKVAPTANVLGVAASQKIAPPSANPKSQPVSETKELEQPEEAIADTPQIQMMPAFSSAGDAGDGDDANVGQPPIQLSLKVGQPGDAYEREAEAMADRVVSMPRAMTSGLAPKTLGTPQPQQVNRKQTVGMRSLMRQQADGRSTPAPKNLESRLQSQGSGAPLDAKTRTEMEGAFDADFSNVQVQTGQESATLNQDLGARAFTHGNKIFFNSGEYQPQSQPGKHLLAHELTHTIQQGHAVQRNAEAPPSVQQEQSTPNLQKAPAAAGNQPTLSSEVVDVSSNIFKPSDKVKAEIEAQGDKGLDVRVIIKGVTSEGRVKIKLDRQGNYDSVGKKGYLPVTNPWAQQLGEMFINFSVKNNEITGGYASLKRGGGNTNDWLQALQKNLSLLGGGGLKVEKLPTPINKLENGKLILGVNNLKVEIGGYVDAQFTLLLENNNKPKIDATANINVKGVAQGVLKLDNTQDKLAGEVSLAINVKAFNGEAKVKYNPDGTVDIGGKAAYNANKLSGEIQFVSTDLGAANKFAKDAIAAAGGINNVQNAPPPAPVPPPKSGKKQRALAATGQLAFNLTTWFAGTVNVVVDGEGHVTVIGKIAPPAEIELFKQKDWDKELIKFEAKAYYGIPVVGNLNLFANISLHALAKLGPAKIDKIEVLGTYSTDPEIQKNIQISASFNISAYAGLRLRAEGGAGIEILEHDLKFGVGLNADVGVKAYAEARPTIGYREPGEFYVSGTLEMVAQPMLGLGGDFFIELETPWWSPLSDKKWIWPLFSKEWPLTDPIGISASVKDYVLGSGKVPEVEMKKPEFDPSKFMTSMVDNKLPDKSGGQATGQGTFKEDGSVPKPTVPPKKPEPKKADVKPGKKGTPPQGGKSAAPNPKVAKDPESTKILQQASKLLASLKGKAPFTLIDLNKELAKIKGQVSGIDFAVQPKGEMWVVTPKPKAGGKPGNPLELGAKDAKGFGKKDKSGKYDGQIGKVVTFAVAKESHRLWIVLQGNNAVVMMASAEKPVAKHLNDYEKMAQELQDQEKKTKVTTPISQARDILNGLDKNADKLAADATKPEVKSEEVAAENDAVKSGEDKLKSPIEEIIKEIQGALRPEELKGILTPRLDELQKKEPKVSQRYVDDWKTYSTGGGKQPIRVYVDGRAARKLGKISEDPALEFYSQINYEGYSKNNDAIEFLKEDQTLGGKKELALEKSPDRPNGYRIPDIFREGQRVGDVKKVKELSLDSQMRDNVRIAKGDKVRLQGKTTLLAPAGRFDLVVRAPSDELPNGTHVSGTLEDAVTGTGGHIFQLL